MSAKSSRWCGGTIWCVERVSCVLYLNISVVAQKKAADSTYPMGIYRWNPTSWSSSGVAFGTRNDTDGMSSMQTHMCMYAYNRSTLLSKVGPSLGGAARMQSIILWRTFPKQNASLWDTWMNASLRPLQEKSYMRRGSLPCCGMSARGDRQNKGRWWTAHRGYRTIWPARACFPSSVLTKVVSFVVEEWAPYLIALVSYLFVMPLFVLIGTLFTSMCSRSVAAGFWLGGICLSSCGPLASTHA